MLSACLACLVALPYLRCNKEKKRQERYFELNFSMAFSSDVVELTCGTLHNSDKVYDEKLLGEQGGKAVVEMSK